MKIVASVVYVINEKLPEIISLNNLIGEKA
jgi:hypothetical protein